MNKLWKPNDRIKWLDEPGVIVRQLRTKDGDLMGYLVKLDSGKEIGVSKYLESEVPE